MAYVYTPIGWEDESGDRHEISADRDIPQDLSDVYGVKVWAFDPDNPEDQHHFWAWIGGAFESWDEWDAYIDALIDMYGEIW